MSTLEYLIDNEDQWFIKDQDYDQSYQDIIDNYTSHKEEWS